MSRNARTLAQHSRRIALGFGTAAGAAAIATSLSMGTAPVAGADVSDADAVSSLAGALDLSALGAAGAADAAVTVPTNVSPTDAISYLIDALDPQQFTSTGSPAGLVGDVGWYLDYYLFGPTGVFYFVDESLEPSVVDLVNSLAGDTTSAAAVGAANSVSDVIGALDPTAFNPLDSVIDGLVGSSSLF